MLAAWFDSGFMFLGRLWTTVNSNPEAFRLQSSRMEKRAQSMLLVVVALSAARTLTLDTISGALQMAVCGNFRCVVQHFCGGPR